MNDKELGGLGAAATAETQAPATDTAKPAPVATLPAASARLAVATASPVTPAKLTTVATVPGAGAPSNGTTPGPATGAGYRIGAHDVLEVSVFKVPELSKSVQVGDSGTISLPLVGDVAAAGRTPQEIERELTQKLGAKYLQSPQVSVFVKEFNSQRITVDGAVKKPGVLPYRSSVTLLQVIAMADGLDPNSDSTVVVFRDEGGKRTAARFDVDEIRSGAADDPAIEPGDTIVVGSSMLKSAFNNVLKALPLAGLFVGL